MKTLMMASWVMVVGPLAAQTDRVPAWQTEAGGKLKFEVASVRVSQGAFRAPSFPLDEGNAFRPTGGLFHADFNLWVCIQFAYKFRYTTEQMQEALAHLPKWVSEDRFTIQARAEGTPTKDQFRLMMQSLLAERFQLAVHFETRVVPVFALTLAKQGILGPKLIPHDKGPVCPSGADRDADEFPPVCETYGMRSKGREHKLGSRNTTIDLMASAIAGPSGLGRPVVDRTGLSGRFDFTVEWTTEPTGAAAADPGGPTFLEALREQLGMKLDAAKAPVEFLVVDHVERPSEN